MEQPNMDLHTENDVPGLLADVGEDASPSEAGKQSVFTGLPSNKESEQVAGRMLSVGDVNGKHSDPGKTGVECGSDSDSDKDAGRAPSCDGRSRKAVISSSKEKCDESVAEGEEADKKRTSPQRPRSVTLADGVEVMRPNTNAALTSSASPLRKSHPKRSTAWEIAIHNPRRMSHSSKRNTTHRRFTIMKDLRASLAAEAASGWEWRSKSSTGRPSAKGHRTTAEGVLRDASLRSSRKVNKEPFDFDSTWRSTDAPQSYFRKKSAGWHRKCFGMGWGHQMEDETTDFAARMFHIRERRNPDLGQRLTQIYNRSGSSNGQAWSYQSKPAIAVTGCICIIALWTLWFAPFIASFWHAYQPLCEALTRADFALDLLYTACTLLTLKISYVDMDSRVEVTDPTIIKSVAIHAPFFYYELLSSCFVVPILAAGPNLRYLLLLKLLRAINLWSLPRWTDRLRVKPMFLVFRLLAALFTVQHVVACVLNYVIEREELWSDYIGQTKGDTDKYTLCYNYAINMLQAQISKGELLSRLEGGIYCVVAPLGTLMVATLYGEINVLYQRLNILSDRHVESMAYITEAMRTLKLPSEMQGRVHQYFRFLHANRDKTAVSTLLDSLSEPLLQELKLNLYGDLIHKANFFKHCNPEFVRMILMKLHDCVYCPGDNIIQTGQEGDCMYFILKGTVDVLIEGSPILASKGEGDYFGELALLKPGTSRTATLRARTYTIVARLYARDFDEALEKYPNEMMNAFAGMNLLDSQELAMTLEEAKARIARAKEKKNV